MTNRFLEHTGAKYPIIQAPMGWIARSQLASAVCAAGGLGIPKVERHHCLLQRWVAVAQVLGTAANARRTQDLCAVPWALWTATQ